MSWRPINKAWGLYEVDVDAMLKRIPKCLLNAKKEATVLRLLSLTERAISLVQFDFTAEAFKHPDNQF